MVGGRCIGGRWVGGRWADRHVCGGELLHPSSRTEALVCTYVKAVAMKELDGTMSPDVVLRCCDAVALRCCGAEHSVAGEPIPSALSAAVTVCASLVSPQSSPEPPGRGRSGTFSPDLHKLPTTAITVLSLRGVLGVAFSQNNFFFSSAAAW